MTELTFILLFALLAYYWYSQVTALDACRQIGKQITQQKGWVFLDDSLLQKRITITPRRGKLAWLREFEFEFSDLEAKRYNGSITYHGGTATEIKFFHAEHIETLPLVNQ